MARHFNNSPPYQWLEQSSDLGLTGPRNFSVSLWVRPDATNRQTLFYIGDSTSKKRMDVVQIQAQSHVGVWSQYDNRSREAITSGTMTIGEPLHVFGIFDDATDSNTAYIRGTDKATDTYALPGATVYDNCAIAMSRDNSPSHPYVGAIGEICVWNTVEWTDEEIFNMGYGFSPYFFQPDKIVAYWRLWRDNDNNLFELYDFTPINSPTTSDHFPIIYPGSPPLIGGGPIVTTDYEYTATGGLTIDGTSDADWGTSYIADADNAIGGSADATQPIYYTGDAALNLDGTSDADWGTTYIVEAGFIIGGTGELDVGKEYVGDSSLTLGGTSDADWGTTYLVYDGLILGGTSDADWGTTYIVYVGLTVNGDVPPDWASHYDFSGGLILGFNAQTQIDWGTHFEIVGGVTIGFLAYTTYDWGTTYLVYGGLTLDGTAGGVSDGWRVDYYPVPGLFIDGSSPYEPHILYGIDANLYFGCDYNLADYGYFTIDDWDAFFNGWVTISGDNLSIDVSNLYGDEKGLAYYDHLPPYDELFAHKFDFYKDLANSDTNAWVSVWGMSNTIDGLGNLLFSNAQAVGVRHYQNAIRLVNYESGELSTDLTLSDQRYYVTVDRATAGTITMYVYNDAGRTSLHGQRSVSIVATRAFQYILGFNNHENAFSSSYRWSGDVSNLEVEHVGYEHRDYRCYSSDADWGVSYLPTGGLTCGGAAEDELCLSYAEDANLYLSGTSDADWGTTYWVYGDQLVLNGTSQADWGTTYVVYAGLIIGGSGEYTLLGSYEPVGGLLLGGTSPVAWGTTYIVTEGLTISGDGGISQGVGYDGDASLIIGGTSDADWGTTYLVLAGLIIGGSGGHTGGLGMDYDGDASLIINGTSDADWGTTYIVYVGLLVSGETPPDWATHYDFSGGLIIGISADTQIDWATHYQWEGGLVIGFNAVTTYDWGTTYIVEARLTIGGDGGIGQEIGYDGDASLIIGGTSPAAWGTTYIVYADLVLNGTSDADWGTTYIVYVGLLIGGSSDSTLPGFYNPFGGLVLGGTSPVAWGTTYIVEADLVIGGSIDAEGGLGIGYVGDASLIIGGTSDADWGTTYIVYAGLIIGGEGDTDGGLGIGYGGDASLIIGGTSDADWGTTYIVYVGLLVSGETPPDWASHYDFSGGLIIGIAADTDIDWSTHYQWEGGLVIGFNAVTTYDWGTTYIVEAGLIVGGSAGGADNGLGIGYGGDASLIIGGTSDADWGTTYIVYASLVIGGTVDAEGGLGIGYGGDASLIIGGTSDADWGTTYIVYVGLLVSGETPLDWATHYDFSGGLIIGISAQTQIDWATHYAWEGGLVIEFGAQTTYDWGTTYIVEAGLTVGGSAGGADNGLGLGYGGDASLIIGGTSDADWGTTYIVYAGLVIGGEGDTTLPGSYNPVGGLVISGTSDADWGTTYIVEADLIIGGSADGAGDGLGLEYGGDASLIIGGTSDADWGTTYIVYAGLVIGGEGDATLPGEYNPVGGLVIGGTSPAAWGTTYIVEADLIIGGSAGGVGDGLGLEYGGDASLIIGGTSPVAWGTTYIVYDGPYLILGGTSDADWGTTYIVYVGLVVAGETPPDWSTHYDFFGGLIIGVSADTQIDWSTHYTWEGGLVIGFNAVTTYDWGTTYIVEAGLTIGGSAGGADNGLGLGYDGDASLIIGGTSPAAWGTTYIVEADLVIGGSAGGAENGLGLGYDGDASLIIGGTSDADWGTTYIVYAGLIVGGTTQPEYGADFEVIGGFVLGIGSFATYDWGTTYIVYAGLVIGGSGGVSLPGEYVPVGGLVLNGTSDADWGTTYLITDGLTIGGSGDTEGGLGIGYGGDASLIIGGTSPVAWGTTYIVQVGLIVGGSSDLEYGADFEFTGGLILGLGSFTTYDWGTTYIVQVGLVVGGSSDLEYGADFEFTGGLILGLGSLTTYDWGTTYIVDVGLLIQDQDSAQPDWITHYEFVGAALTVTGTTTAPVSWGTTYIVRDGPYLVLNGTSPADWGTTYIVQVGLVVSGDVPPDWSSDYQWSGGLIIGIGADSQVDWSTHYEWEGGLVIEFGTQTTYDWGTTYIVEAGLIIGGSIDAEGGLGIGYDGDASLIIGGTSDADWGTTYIVYVGLVIGGSAEAPTADHEYTGGGGLIIGGTSPADWGTTYIPTDGLYLCGDRVPGEDFCSNDYIELDDYGAIDIDCDRIFVTDLPRSNMLQYDHRVYMDKGAGHFGSTFTHTFALHVDSAADTQSFMGLWGVSNEVNRLQLFTVNDSEALSIYYFNGKLNLENYEKTPQVRVSSTDIAKGTTYYLTITRNATSVVAKIYDDPGRTNHINTISTTVSAARTYRYFLPVNNADVRPYPEEHPFTGWVSAVNLDDGAFRRDCGTTDVDWGTSDSSGGGLVVGGGAEAGIVSHTFAYIAGVDGGLVVEGAAIVPSINRFAYVADGGLIIDGEDASSTWRVDYYPELVLGLLIAGGAAIIRHRAYIPSGSLIIEAQASVSVSHYIVVGNVDLILGPRWGVWAEAELVLGGHSPFTVHYVYIANYEFEDLTGYVIDDPHGKFIIRSGSIEVDGILASQRAMAYTPQGKKLLDQFTHTFRAITYSSSHPQAVMSWWAVSKQVADMSIWEASNEEALSVGWDSGRIYLRNFANGEQDYYFPANEDQWYRIYITRRQVTNEEDIVQAEIYTDDWTHLHTLQVSDDTLRVYNNIFVANSPNSFGDVYPYAGAAGPHEWIQEGRAFDLWGASSYQPSAYNYTPVGGIEIEAQAPSAIVSANHYQYDIPVELILGGTGFDPYTYTPVGSLDLTPSHEVAVSYTFDPLFPWNFDEPLGDIELLFSWSFGGECEQHWYRVEGICIESSCETTGVVTGEGCPVMYFQYFLACNLEDLARQIHESGLKWPIDSITRASSSWTGERDACERFVDVPWEEHPDFLEFTLLTGLYVPNVHIGAITYDSAELRTVDGNGGLVLGGVSLVQPVIPIASLEISGTSPVVSSDGTVVGLWDFGTLSVGMGTDITTEYEEYTWADPLAGAIDMLPTTTIPTDCVVPIMPHVIHMSHTLDRDNILADFLLRNNIIMPNVEMRYHPFSRTWQGNLHYSGYGQMASDDEKWALMFEWACESEVSDITLSGSVWTFAITIVRELATAGSNGYIISPAMRRLDSSKIVLAFDPRNIFANETLDVSFILNTLSGVVIADPYTITVVNVLNDGIGLFNDPRWNDNPNLRVHVTSLVPRQPQEWYDITPIIPQSIFETV